MVRRSSHFKIVDPEGSLRGRLGKELTALSDWYLSLPSEGFTDISLAGFYGTLVRSYRAKASSGQARTFLRYTPSPVLKRPGTVPFVLYFGPQAMLPLPS